MNSRNLTVSPKAVMVSTDTACAVLGVDSEALACMVETGDLVWVWDVSARQKAIRELRFWTQELIDPTTARKPYSEFIGTILPPNRERFRSSEVAQTLRISDPHLLRLIKLGELTGTIVGHTRWITRRSFADFLKNRLLNGPSPESPKVLSRN